ncbi:MAG: leucine-rich repeat domain-containing protein [Clostridiales bacterium]|nr:leucine-rich repeat domain-containing protein [Clostridiales bacterium]
MKRRNWLLTFVLSVCVCLMCALGFVACGKDKGGLSADKFSAVNVSRIELGMSQKQVRDIIGIPDDLDEDGYTYYWYEDKAKNLFAAIEQAEEELWDDAFDFDEDLDDFGKEDNLLDRLDQLYMQLEEMTYKFIMVTFSSDEKVTSVYLDCEHVYDEDDDYSSARKKTVWNVRLDVDKVDASTGKLYTFDGEAITEEETLHIVTKVSNAKYSAQFSDGSYIKRTTTPSCLGFTDDKKQVKYQWFDMVGTYDVQIAVNVQGESNLLVVAEGVTTISSDDIAEYADKVDMVSLPSTLIEIGDNAFKDCSNLQYNIKDGLKYLGNENNPYIYLADTETTDITSATVENGCKFIGYKAFSGCSRLTEIVIPDSVESIGEDAFSGCGNLTTVTCPTLAISYIPKSNLQKIVLTSGDSIGFQAFYDCRNLTEIVIPDSVTSIGVQAFYNCWSLKSVYITDISAWVSIDFNVSNNGTSANPFGHCNLFLNNELVTQLIIPDGVTRIGEGAFCGYDDLTKIVIPDSVTSIGRYAFSYCDGLAEIVIPDSVTSIGDSVFYDCSKLIIYCEAERKPDGWDEDWRDYSDYIPVIWDCNNNDVADDGYIYTVVDGVRYKLKDGVATVAKQPKNITVANILETVTYKDAVYSVTSIGNYAFYYCYNLTEIVIPDSVTSIGASAFYGCSSLTSIAVSENSAKYKSIDGNLYNKKGTELIQYAIGKTATSFTIPDSVTSIGIGAFGSCSSLTSVVIPDSVTSIGIDAFYSCDSLTIYCEVTSKPSGWDSKWNPSDCPVVWDCNNNDVANDGYIYTVVDGVRYKLKDGVATVAKQPKNITVANILETVTYKGVVYSVTSIGNAAFYECSSLTEIIIPDSVTRIGSHAFSGCGCLTEIVIPDGVTRIDSQAFYGCGSLTSITFKDTATWYRHPNYSGGAETRMDVTISSTNATYFKTYYNYYWYKT